jgi:site-specific recombinase XerD
MLDNASLLTRFAAEHYEPQSISPARRRESDTLLGQLGARLGDRILIELTPSDLMVWQGYERERGIKPTTIRKRQNMIRSFIGWAYSADLISFELTTRLKSVNGVAGSSIDSAPRPYKRSEIQRFRKLLAEKYPLAPTRGTGSLMMKRYLTGSSRFKGPVRLHARRLQFEAQVSLALEEGLRRIELGRLTLAEMHYDNASVVVRTAKSKPGQDRWREVPFTAHSRQCVREWLDFRALIVPDHDKPWLTLRNYDPIGPQSDSHLSEALQVFGEPYFCWHRFRHTFATERLRAGMPLEQLQVMMGHARLEQTLAYAAIVSADVRVEAERTEEDFERALGVVA